MHDSRRNGPSLSRRRFAAGLAAVATATVASPAFARARRLAAAETIIGEGEHRFRVKHHFPQLPDPFTWQTTHGVALDEAGNLYVIHEGRKDRKDHPSIFVFDPEGKFVRAFGSEFQGGGHGIEVRKEGNEEFLYVCGYQDVKCFAKLTPEGEIVWFRKAPMEAGCYAAGEDTSTTKNWTRQGFLPTNFAFLDDGGFLLRRLRIVSDSPLRQRCEMALIIRRRGGGQGHVQHAPRDLDRPPRGPRADDRGLRPGPQHAPTLLPRRHL
jgi:hypothetical protein